MLKPLTGGPLKKLGGGKLKPLNSGIKQKRPPLAVPEIDDPMEGFDEADPDVPGQKSEVAMSAALKSLHKKREDEAKSMELTTDGAFYFVAVFDTRDQKMAYLRALGMADEGDIYVDGRMMADKINARMQTLAETIIDLATFSGKIAEKIRSLVSGDLIKLPTVEVKMPKLFRIDKKYGALALKKGER